MCFRSRNNHIIIYVLLNMFVAYYYVYLYFQDTTFWKVPDSESQARHMKKELLKLQKSKNKSGCKIPRLDPFSNEVRRFRWRPSKIRCPGKDWVKCYLQEITDLSACKVVPEILNTTSDIKCIYKSIIYINDDAYAMGYRTVVLDDGIYTLTKSDHVKIWCTGERNESLVSWSGVATGFRTSVKRYCVPPEREDSLNVLLLGFDSTSKNGFIRQMPKTYQHLTNTMGAVILNGHNVVQTGTAGALIPMLTGMSMSEVPNARYSPTNNITVDDLPLIFYILQKYGYRTAYFEDMPWIGTFQYRFNSFRRQPADHYLRSFYMEENKLSPKLLYCVGDTRMHKLMMNITDQFLRLDGPKFILTFIADITHDRFNMISSADEDLVKLLNTLKSEGVLENTLVIVMGDHGARYEPIRNTYQGKLEEYLPLMAVILPEKLKQRRPTALAALKHNKDVLTTHYDIHTTLLDVLDLNKLSNRYKVPGSNLRRSMSLLEKIPKTRTCMDAGIHPHFCACTEWKSVNNRSAMYTNVAIELAWYIDNIVKERRDVCARRELASIKWVKFYIPKRRYGINRNVSAKASYKYYQAKIIMNPGNSMFEGTMIYHVKTDTFYTDPSYISGPYAVHVKCNCLDKIYVHLFPFCYCRDELNSNNVTKT